MAVAPSNKKRANGGAFVDRSPDNVKYANAGARQFVASWERTPPHFREPYELEAKLTEFLGICIYGRLVTDIDNNPVLDHNNEEVRIHDDTTVPTMTSAAWHCGFRSRQSLYEYEAKGGKWAAIVNGFREGIENWLVTRGIRSKQGDNPIFMSMVLQARFGYARSDAAKDEEQPDDQKQIASTPEDVQRVIASMDLGDLDEKDG